MITSIVIGFGKCSYTGDCDADNRIGYVWIGRDGIGSEDVGRVGYVRTPPTPTILRRMPENHDKEN